ncbi:hypothetical protein D9611_012281 [Ephemerocybe angulata]|uniref:C2H2-type domain-containing protein n=1 Tax=Ephemerocybe angulata TaxID=980116 RepID=A0A8H5ATS0_9AGAR|nr:hypothetical protein D9611_012281 [Tulosesus angulatus]
MRLSLIALVPLTALLSSVVHARSDYTYEAREHIDELATRAFDDSLLTTRQDLADLSTRDLLNELQDRLQRRESTLERLKRWLKMKWPSGKYYCVECGGTYARPYTKSEAIKHIKESGSKHILWIKNGKNGEPIDFIWKPQ